MQFLHMGLPRFLLTKHFPPFCSERLWHYVLDTVIPDRAQFTFAVVLQPVQDVPADLERDRAPFLGEPE